jgi:multidrug efflux system outer membrane protein
VADVPGAYFQWRALDVELEVSKRTLDSRQESRRLTRILAHGVRLLSWTCATPSNWFFAASAEIPTLEQQIEQRENLLSILLGQNPGDVPRGQASTDNKREIIKAMMRRFPNRHPVHQQSPQR